MPGDRAAITATITWRERLVAQRWAFVAVVCLAAAGFALLPLPVAAFAAALAAIAVAIAVVDLEYLIIPDAANAALAVLGIALVASEAARGGLWTSLGGAVLRAIVAGGALYALRFVYLWRRGIDGLGLGDVKLAAAGAPWLAWTTLPVALVIAAAGALISVATRSLASRQAPDRAAEIPFGAFLAPAIWLAFMLERGGFLDF